jgi:hypothetical protein
VRPDAAKRPDGRVSARGFGTEPADLFAPHTGEDAQVVRSNLFRAVFIALLVVLAIPGVALAAKPIAAFHDHFTDSFSGDVCGIPVDIKVVVTDNFSLYADGSFKDTSSAMQTFTNPENGRSVVLSNAGNVSGTAIIDELAGTITFVTTYRGLPEKIQTAHGAVLLRDAGVISFADTFDLATGEFLGSEVTVNGPHPEADSGFVLFCEVITNALT